MAFNHTTRAETQYTWEPDRTGSEPNFDWFSLDIHLVTYKLASIYYYNF